MQPDEPQRPWEQLERLIDGSDAEQVGTYLDSLSAGEALRAVTRLEEADQAELLTMLTPGDAAEILDRLPEMQAVELLESLAPSAAAAIVSELPSDEQADLFAELDDTDADAILAAMDPEDAAEIRVLKEYEDDVAGGLMITEYVAFPDDRTVSQVVDEMRERADEFRSYKVQYAYVIQSDGVLSGVLSLRDLLLAPRSRPIRDLMIPSPLTVKVDAELEDLQDLFESHAFFGVPVVDADGRLQGVVQREAVQEALGEQAASDFRRAQGLVQEELRTMPVWTRSRRRLAWLSVNILLNVMAASVIAAYQETLQQVIALAVFLPIISDMSGCSGGQAVAVSMRELTLGVVKPNELLRVWGKELSVGMINGFALGLLIAAVALIWKGNPYLGLVVGGGLCLNTMVAVSMGGLLPLLMKLMKLDPALASGPILTTVTDMCGFFLILSFASALLPRLL